MRRELLTAAIEALEDQRDPLAEGFLRANEVSLDEAYDLSDLLALGLRFVRYAQDHPEDASAALRGAADSLNLTIITARLQAMNEATGAT